MTWDYLASDDEKITNQLNIRHYDARERGAKAFTVSPCQPPASEQYPQDWIAGWKSSDKAYAENPAYRRLIGRRRAKIAAKRARARIERYRELAG